jgi:hypothetical protein
VRSLIEHWNTKLTTQDLEKTIDTLPALDDKQLKSGNLPHDHIVLLLSRSFAPYLTQSSLVRDIINKLYKNAGFAKVTASVMVVDAVPDLIAGGLNLQPAHGLSFCTSPRVLTSYGHDDEAAHIDLVLNTSAGGEETRLQIPGANTLFVNGQEFTCQQLAFKKSDGEYKRQGGENVTTSRATIISELPTLEGLISCHTLLLTPPREILASLGNVIRQISGASGDPAPSAEELTIRLDDCNAWIQEPEIANQFSGLTGTYALVMSPEVQHLVSETEELNTNLELDAVNSFDLYEKLRLGAQLFRVSGGGGQWKGADRLTLETIPEFRAPQPTEGEPYFENGVFKFPESQVLAPPGYTIQFFAVLNPRNALVSTGSGAEQFLVGCVTHEAIEDIKPDLGSPDVFAFDRFGALTTFGYGASWTPQGSQSSRFMVNIPFSSLGYRFGGASKSLSDNSIASQHQRRNYHTSARYDSKHSQPMQPVNHQAKSDNAQHERNFKTVASSSDLRITRHAKEVNEIWRKSSTMITCRLT